jgi:hypothetical protein
MWTKRIAASIAVAGLLTAGTASAAFAASAEPTAQSAAAPGWHKVDEWLSDGALFWDFCYIQADWYRSQPDVRTAECRWAAPHNVQLWIRTDA